MNLKIDILTKKGITNVDIFLSFFLYFTINFKKISKTTLKTVVDEAIETFL